MSERCRLRGGQPIQVVVDLGATPIVNSYLRPIPLTEAESGFPLYPYFSSDLDALLTRSQVPLPEVRVFP